MNVAEMVGCDRGEKCQAKRMGLEDALDEGHLRLHNADDQAKSRHPRLSDPVWVCEHCDGRRIGIVSNPAVARDVRAYDAGYAGEPPPSATTFANDPDAGANYIEAYLNGWSDSLDDLIEDDESLLDDDRIDGQQMNVAAIVGCQKGEKCKAMRLKDLDGVEKCLRIRGENWLCGHCDDWDSGRAKGRRDAAARNRNPGVWESAYAGKPPQPPSVFVGNPGAGEDYIEVYFEGWSKALDDLVSEDDSDDDTLLDDDQIDASLAELDELYKLTEAERAEKGIVLLSEADAPRSRRRGGRGNSYDRFMAAVKAEEKRNGDPRRKLSLVDRLSLLFARH